MIRTGVRRLGLLACLPLALIATACSGDRPPVQDNAAEGQVLLPKGVSLKASNRGGFYAAWQPSTEFVPLNEEFDARVWLFRDAKGLQPLEVDAVSIDCRMPGHRHGMLHDVSLDSQDDGSFLAQGMLCHMAGNWVLHVDVRREELTERAQFEFHLD